MKMRIMLPATFQDIIKCLFLDSWETIIELLTYRNLLLRQNLA